MLVDKSAEKIVKTVKSTGAVVTGPIPLPTHKKLFTVLRSPHVNKKAREQFEVMSYKRLIDIYSSSSKTIDALMKLELPSGVEVEIKVWFYHVFLQKKRDRNVSLFFIVNGLWFLFCKTFLDFFHCEAFGCAV